MTKKLSVGGQAVIEGVMMKGPEKMAVAVRQANGEIAVDVKPVSSIRDRYPFFKKPFLRGVVSLVESLVDGMKALSYSAQISGEEEEKLDDKEMALTITVSVLLAVLLFVVVPTGAMRLLQDRGVGPVALNLVEGFLRLGIFLLYIGAIRGSKRFSGSSNTMEPSTRPSTPMNTDSPLSWRTCVLFRRSIPAAGRTSS